MVVVKNKRRLLLGLAFLAAIIFLSIYLNFHSPNIPDPDSFYHIGHAEVYREGGIWQRDFPWTQFSVINSYSADIWYGFHILLIPLTFTADPIFGIKLASVFSSLAAFLLLFWVFWRLDRFISLANSLSRTFLWLAIFITSSSSLLFRLIMLRPHPLSLALSLLLFSFLIAPAPLLLFFILGFLFSWLHLALSWLPVIVFFTIAGAGVLVSGRMSSIKWREGIALFLGLSAGFLLRPNPLGAVKIAYIQVVEFFLKKQSELPIQFGSEMLKSNWSVFLAELWPFLLLFLGALVFLIFKLRNKNPLKKLKPAVAGALISSFVLSAFFLALAFFVASRSQELVIGFAMIFIITAFLASDRSGEPDAKYAAPSREHKRRRLAFAALAILFIAIQIFILVPRFKFFLRNSAKPETLKASSLWLRDNSKVGSIVFNPHWDNFAQSFFWNRRNYYINGMDPIFEYSFNPELYWKTHYLAVGLASDLTCGAVACSREEAVPVYEVLRNDFRASYVVLQRRRTPKFYEYLNSAPVFKKVFETEEEAVFEIK